MHVLGMGGPEFQETNVYVRAAERQRALEPQRSRAWIHHIERNQPTIQGFHEGLFRDTVADIGSVILKGAQRALTIAREAWRGHVNPAITAPLGEIAANESASVDTIPDRDIA